MWRTAGIDEHDIQALWVVSLAGAKMKHGMGYDAISGID